MEVIIIVQEIIIIIVHENLTPRLFSVIIVVGVYYQPRKIVKMKGK